MPVVAVAINVIPAMSAIRPQFHKQTFDIFCYITY